MKKHQFTIFALAVIFSATAIIGNGQTCPPLTAGCLDYTFGGGMGTNTTYVPNYVDYLWQENAALQSDGKILGLFDLPTDAGKDVVIRYNADGTLDTGFASGGFLYVNWNIPNYAAPGFAHVIAVQTIGGQEKILVAGQYSSTNLQIGLQVDRYNPDGSIDTTFGTSGTVKYGYTFARAIAVQADGKILTTGTSGDLVRLNINGTLDTTFGSGGVAKISTLTPTSLAVQSNGRIVVLGYSTSKGKDLMTAARFNSNGSPDDGGRKDSTPGDSFGTSGIRTIDFFAGGTSKPFPGNNTLKIDANGKILAAGYATPNNSVFNDFAIARLTSNGQFDTTFDGDGKAVFDLSQHDYLKSIALQSNGKIVLFGSIDNATHTGDLGMLRLNTNGSLDTSFGSDGIVISDFSPTGEPNYTGLVQIDPICACEKIAVVGTVDMSGIDYAITARYLP